MKGEEIVQNEEGTRMREGDRTVEEREKCKSVSLLVPLSSVTRKAEAKTDWRNFYAHRLHPDQPF